MLLFLQNRDTNVKTEKIYIVSITLSNNYVIHNNS